MASKQNSFVMLNLPTSDSVAKSLHSDLLLIAQVVMGGWKSYNEIYSPALRARHKPRVRADIINEEIVYKAEEVFAGRPGVRTDYVNSMFVVFFNSQLSVRFKKLDKNFRARNIPTQQTVNYRDQQFTLPTVGRMLSLFAGYRLNDIATEIEGVYLMCPKGKGAHWITELKVSPASNVVQLPEAGTRKAGFKPKQTKQDDQSENGTGRS